MKLLTEAKHYIEVGIRRAQERITLVMENRPGTGNDFNGYIHIPVQEAEPLIQKIVHHMEQRNL